ncbi:hypothetical protein JKP88DRAFT_283681 [Tribonema minus]|uniref:Uncharacterized protein n=1 Tax=Tribonema minus TaxID=303371 RepID=A0A836C7B2_9STRA|nr:hypothetical protein JKP88DRAFT_283681 [Tribonema minus]
MARCLVRHAAKVARFSSQANAKAATRNQWTEAQMVILLRQLGDEQKNPAARKTRDNVALKASFTEILGTMLAITSCRYRNQEGVMVTEAVDWSNLTSMTQQKVSDKWEYLKAEFERKERADEKGTGLSGDENVAERAALAAAVISLEQQAQEERKDAKFLKASNTELVKLMTKQAAVPRNMTPEDIARIRELTGRIARKQDPVSINSGASDNSDDGRSSSSDDNSEDGEGGGVARAAGSGSGASSSRSASKPPPRSRVQYLPNDEDSDAAEGEEVARVASSGSRVSSSRSACKPPRTKVRYHDDAGEAALLGETKAMAKLIMEGREQQALAAEVAREAQAKRDEERLEYEKQTEKTAV